MDAIIQYTNSITNMNVVVQQMITTMQPFIGVIDDGISGAADTAGNATNEVKKLVEELREIDKAHWVRVNDLEIREAIKQTEVLQKLFKDGETAKSVISAPGNPAISRPMNMQGVELLPGSGDPASVGNGFRNIPEQVASMQALTETTRATIEVTQQLGEEWGSKLGEHAQSFISLMQGCTDLTRQFGMDTSTVQPIIDGLSTGLGIYNSVVDIAKIKVGEFTVAEWLLNSAFLANPITWIVGGILALIGVIVYAWKHFDGFRAAVTGVWESMKAFGNLLGELIIERIKGIISGIGGIAKAIGLLFDGEFSAAVDAGKQALVDLSGINTVKKGIEGTKSAVEVGIKAYGNEMNVSAQKAKPDKNIIPGSPVPTVAFPGMGGKGIVSGQQMSPQLVLPARGSDVNAGMGQSNGGEGFSQGNSITGGGSKIINISIGKFFDNMNITAQNMSEGIEDFERRVEEIFLRIVNSASTANG